MFPRGRLASPSVTAEIGSAQSVVDGTESPGVVGNAGATSFLERARLRRRLRFLTRRRELALHDLGGFVFEEHRLGQSRPELEAAKLAALDALDTELATLQYALAMREELTVLREAGLASCPECREIHDSAANYCPTCGRATAERSPVRPPTPRGATPEP
jgi:hypothetical protein